MERRAKVGRRHFSNFSVNGHWKWEKVSLLQATSSHFHPNERPFRWISDRLIGTKTPICPVLHSSL